jgi:hypothetical protein
MMWHGGYGYRRGGFFLPWLLVGFFVLFVFGKFLFPLLFLVFLAAPFIYFAKMHGGGHWRNWDNYPKRKYGRFDVEDKRKRDSDEPRYTQTASGEWVEIV